MPVGESGPRKLWRRQCDSQNRLEPRHEIQQVAFEPSPTLGEPASPPHWKQLQLSCELAKYIPWSTFLHNLHQASCLVSEIHVSGLNGSQHGITAVLLLAINKFLALGIACFDQAQKVLQAKPQGEVMPGQGWPTHKKT